MENLPVEVIGNILSHLGDALDVVVASATCRKWRDAFCKHLHLLSFNYNKCPLYRDLITSRLEILITKTIFQTTGLQGLTILMDDEEFSASIVFAWLMYTRESLRQLNYNFRTLPTLHLLDVCERQRLEMLSLANNSIPGFDPNNYQRFVNLTSLSLSYVKISSLDLSLLITACPKIESLALVSPYIDIMEASVTVELTSSTLKSIYVEAISIDTFILEADSLEKLHLKECVLDLFELIGKGTLMQFKLDGVFIKYLDIDETVENLEVVDVNDFFIIWDQFFHIISKSSNLRVLRLSDVTYEGYDDHEIVNLKTIAVWFSQLSHLSLMYDQKAAALQYNLEGSYLLQNVTQLEVGWTILTDHFSSWIEELLLHCPQLKKLIVHGNVSDAKTTECPVLARFTSFVVRLMRKYMHVDVQFDYE